MSQPNPFLASALPDEVERLALLGWHLFPTFPRTRTTPKGAKAAATCDLDQLEAWAQDIPGCGWKVHLGRSRLWAIDCDVPSADHEADGVATLRKLQEVPGQTLPRDPTGQPTTPTLRSGGGGWCLIFSRHAGEQVRGSPRKDLPGLDPLRDEQAITVPPTLHHRTGAPYRWVVAPWDCAEAPAPRWLAKLYEPPPEPAIPKPQRQPTSELAESRLFKALSRVQGAGNGVRNSTLNREAFMMGQWVAEGLIGETYVRTSLFETARMAGLEVRESVATIDAALKRARTMPRRRA